MTEISHNKFKKKGQIIGHVGNSSDWNIGCCRGEAIEGEKRKKKLRDNKWFTTGEYPQHSSKCGTCVYNAASVKCVLELKENGAKSIHCLSMNSSFNWSILLVGQCYTFFFILFFILRIQLACLWCETVNHLKSQFPWGFSLIALDTFNQQNARERCKGCVYSKELFGKRVKDAPI
jgi:hypothetical protein